MRDLTSGGVLTGSLRFLFLVTTLSFLSACAGSAPDFENDPDVLTDTEDIPNRPGVIETVTGKKVEIEF